MKSLNKYVSYFWYLVPIGNIHIGIPKKKKKKEKARNIKEKLKQITNVNIEDTEDTCELKGELRLHK